MTNIISYGFPDKSDHEISISIDKHMNKINIILVDDGEEFNPLNVKEPDLNTPIEEREIGGLGIYFVRQKMNKIEYERENGKNIVRLVKQIN